MRVERDAVPRAQRMFTVGENLYAREMRSEEFAETRAGEKILVVCLQHMPGHSFPIFEIGNNLDVRHGKNCSLPNDPGDLFQKRFRMLDMLEHLDADRLIKLLVYTRKPLRTRCGFAERQSALLQQLQAVWIHFYPDPLMSGRDKGWTIGACSASHVKDGTARGQIIKDETQHLRPGLQHWGPGAVNVCPMQHFALRWKDHFTEMTFPEKSWN